MENIGQFVKDIPPLQDVDPDKFGVSICTIDGQRINFGDYKEYVTQQGISSLASFMIAQEQIGSEELLLFHMGCEPSGKAYNFLELKDDRIPHNPLINSGNIMSCALIFKGE